MDLLIFYNILSDPGISAIAEDDKITALKYIIQYGETEAVTQDAVHEYIAKTLADDDNILASLLRSGKAIGEDLKKAALSDLEMIYNKLYCTTLKYTPSGNSPAFFKGYKESLLKITGADSAKALFEALCSHYKTLGSGILSKYSAFKYDDELTGVIADKNVTFDSLIGLDYQKKILIDNSKAFVEGKTANNVLLFGDRGTGKSSCVKAILNILADEGLRMIEIPKRMITKIPALTDYLSKSPHKYILFLDDLSFESHDSDYRALKIAMDGQLQEHPDNVLIYATSNRRHLIKESWADREGGDVHRNDNMQEALSLSERFGISLVFSAPNQSEYLSIVRGILERNGVECTPELEKRAIVWQMNYGGRNPRLAKQFAASVLAENDKSGHIGLI